MAQTNFTPISLYYSATAAAAPTAGNLVAGELAINTNDGVLYYKDSSGVVQSIASKAGNSGSFTNLAYTGTLTGGTGIVNLGSGQFYKDASGNVGIGVTPKTWSQGKAIEVGNSGTALWNSSTQDNNSLICNSYYNGGFLFAGTGYASRYQQSAGVHIWQTSSASGTVGNAVTFNTSMTLDASGNLLVGTTTASARLTTKGVDATGSNFSLYCQNNTAAAFYVRNDGYINTGLLSVSPYNYNTTGRSAIIDVAGGFGYLASVRAAKTNIQNLNDISWVYNLNPVEFNYRKKDKDNKFTEEFEVEKYYGLVAEEVESVNKELCFYDTDGTLRGVGYDKLTSVLVKAIQELNAKVTALEAQLGAK